jgi:hypothetical protein
MPSLRQIALPFLLSIPAAIQAQAFVPYKDSKCTEPMKMISEDFGTSKEIPELELNVGLNDWEMAAGCSYSKMKFPEAEAMGSSGIVYWKAPKTENNCMNIMMVYKRNPWGAATKLNGDIIINAKEEGCFYSAFAVSLSTTAMKCKECS